MFTSGIELEGYDKLCVELMNLFLLCDDCDLFQAKWVCLLNDLW